MITAYLSLGSNLGDREKNLQVAREYILRNFYDVRFSKVYESEPVELLDQPWFLNQITELRTDWPSETLLEWAQRLEKRMGRQRTIPKGPRTLDIDILLYGKKVQTEQTLILPHPRLFHRRHVLVPLVELVPALRLPPKGISAEEALKKTKDFSQVRTYARS